MKLARAYSLLTVKSVNEELRIIEGIASTPATDRQSDIVVPGGGKWNLPLPLLWMHDHSKPIGHVIEATATDSGITIKAQIARGIAFVDAAWAMIKQGLLRGLSIGFRALANPEPIEGTGGFRWASWELLEISCVTIPANQACTITEIKSFDKQFLLAAPAARPTFHLQTLAELDQEFTISETMTAEDFGRKRDAIKKLNERRSARVAVKPAAVDMEAPVTFARLRDVVKKILVNSFTRDAALSKRVESLEAVIEKPELGDVATVRALERLEDWFAAPVLPIYGPDGRIVGAKRDVSAVKKKGSPSISDVERRLHDLESKPSMKYCGVWAATDSYVEGEFVTHSGSLWACREATKSRPGTDDKWQLAAKKGRDAR